MDDGSAIDTSLITFIDGTLTPTFGVYTTNPIKEGIYNLMMTARFTDNTVTKSSKTFVLTV